MFSLVIILFLMLYLCIDRYVISYTSTIQWNRETTVLFHPPPNVRHIRKRFLLYRLRFDGVACCKHGKNTTYYQVGLEIANCNEYDREKPAMTCFGMLVSKDNLDYLRDYLHRVKVLGINGVWVNKDGQWYHWRWFVVSVGCDTVAQEQLIGEINKKLTGSPFLFGSNQKVRLNPNFLGYQEFYDHALPIENQGKLALPCRPTDFLNPNSLLRCPSLIYHSDTQSLVDTIERENEVVLTDRQKKEVEYLNKLFSLHKNGLHQWLPNVLKEEDIPSFKEDCINDVTSFLDEDNDALSEDQKANISSKLDKVLNRSPKNKVGHNNTNNSTNVNTDDSYSDENNIVDDHGNDNNLLDGNVLCPTKQILCLDSMHNLSNICLIFISIINDKVDCSSLNKVESVVRDLFSCDQQWTLCPSFENVRLAAIERHEELKKLNLVKKDLLNYDTFKRSTCYEEIMYLLSFYFYLFQDSMDNPVIFFFKIIFDYLGYFCNVNYDINHIIEKQRNFNIILGLIQNELLPQYLKISIFNAMFYAYCILNCGDMAPNSCWLSEGGYWSTRANFVRCRDPVLNASHRLMMLSLILQDNLDKEIALDNSITCHTIRKKIKDRDKERKKGIERKEKERLEVLKQAFTKLWCIFPLHIFNYVS